MNILKSDLNKIQTSNSTDRVWLREILQYQIETSHQGREPALLYKYYECMEVICPALYEFTLFGHEIILLNIC